MEFASLIILLIVGVVHGAVTTVTRTLTATSIRTTTLTRTQTPPPVTRTMSVTPPPVTSTVTRASTTITSVSTRTSTVTATAVSISTSTVTSTSVSTLRETVTATSAVTQSASSCPINSATSPTATISPSGTSGPSNPTSTPTCYPQFTVQWENAPGFRLNNYYLSMHQEEYDPDLLEVSYGITGDPDPTNAALLTLDQSTGFVYYTNPAGLATQAFGEVPGLYEKTGLEFMNVPWQEDTRFPHPTEPVTCELVGDQMPAKGNTDLFKCRLGTASQWYSVYDMGGVGLTTFLGANDYALDGIATVQGCTDRLPDTDPRDDGKS